jgi:hypothetical protein
VISRRLEIIDAILTPELNSSIEALHQFDASLTGLLLVPVGLMGLRAIQISIQILLIERMKRYLVSFIFDFEIEIDNEVGFLISGYCDVVAEPTLRIMPNAFDGINDSIILEVVALFPRADLICFCEEQSKSIALCGCDVVKFPILANVTGSLGQCKHISNMLIHCGSSSLVVF